MSVRFCFWWAVGILQQHNAYCRSNIHLPKRTESSDWRLLAFAAGCLFFAISLSAGHEPLGRLGDETVRSRALFLCLSTVQRVFCRTSCVFLLRLTELFNPDKKPCAWQLFVHCLYPIALLSTFIYGTLASAAFSVRALFLALRATDSGKIRFYTGSALCIMLAMLAKPNSAVFLVGLALLFLTAALHRKSVRPVLGLAACVILALGAGELLLLSWNSVPGMTCTTEKPSGPGLPWDYKPGRWRRAGTMNTTTCCMCFINSTTTPSRNRQLPPLEPASPSSAHIQAMRCTFWIENHQPMVRTYVRDFLDQQKCIDRSAGTQLDSGLLCRAGPRRIGPVGRCAADAFVHRCSSCSLEQTKELACGVFDPCSGHVRWICVPYLLGSQKPLYY